MKDIIRNLLSGIIAILIILLVPVVFIGTLFIVSLIPYGVEIFLGLSLIFGIYKLGQYINENY